jgi:transcriptional activator for dhaKLM operon
LASPIRAKLKALQYRIGLTFEPGTIMLAVPPKGNAMQPAQAQSDLKWLLAAWRDFVARGILHPELDPLIANSWQRCAPRLNPETPPQWTYLSSEVLPLTLNQHATLRTIARPILEDSHQFIEGAGNALLLTDSTACVLDMVGDPIMLEHMGRLGLQQGAFFSEGRLGTNALAVALVESCPAQVVGPEHFLCAFHELVSAAAPVFDAEGRPTGAVGLLGRVAHYSPHMLGVAVASARAIENQMQAETFVQIANARASEMNATMDAISDGILAWNVRGTIMYLNNPAGQVLGLNPTTALGRPLTEHVTLPESLVLAIARDEELNDVEVSFGVGGTQHACVVSLRRIRTPEGDPTAFIVTLRPIERVRQLVHQQVGTQARFTLDDMVGVSPAMRRIRRQASSAADAKACVLILGESGNGKTILARAIHNSSRRAAGPFITLNCRAIPRDLAQSEFLGYETTALGPGASGRPSKFELTHGGTLFLEEVESLPLETQATLLRVIEGGDVIRLGGTRVIDVDVRIIASSAADLEDCVANGTFRSDLLFRLSSFVIAVPPLRERPEDIPHVIENLLKKLSVQVGHTLKLTPQASDALNAYPWPGNVRELESVLERAALLCDRQPITLDHLPDPVRQRRAVVPGKTRTEPVYSLIEAERRAILAATRSTSGNLSEAARLLGIGRTTLWRKIKELGIAQDDFKTT